MQFYFILVLCLTLTCKQAAVQGRRGVSGAIRCSPAPRSQWVGKAPHKGGFDCFCGDLRKPGMFGSSLFRYAVNQAMATTCFYELALRQRV